MRKIAVLIMCAWPTIASAATYSLIPVQTLGLQVRYDHGAPVLLSPGPHGVVQIAPISSRLDGRLRLSIVAYNKGGWSANLGYEDISIASEDSTPVRLYTYDQLRHEANKRATWARIGLLVQAVGNGLADANAGNTTVSGVAWGPAGPTTFVANSYNPGIAAAARYADGAQLQLQAEHIDNSLSATMAHLDGSILQTTTIDPGQAGGGELVAEEPKMTKGVSRRIDITVRFNGDTHIVSFYAAKDASLAPVVQSPAPDRLAVGPVALNTSAASPAAPEAPGSCTEDQESYARRVGVDCHALGARWSGY